MDDETKPQRWVRVKEERLINLDTNEEKGGGYECAGSAEDVLAAVQEALKAFGKDHVTVMITAATK